MASRIRPRGHPSISSPAIRYPVAELDSQLIWADKLAQSDRRESGIRCVVCKGAMHLAAGEKLEPYFAHEPASSCADGETALHVTTIRVIRDGVLAAANDKRPFPLALRCRSCFAERQADLARAAHRARVKEVLANGIRPDLLVLSATDRPIYVVEVVVTREPERDALQLYEDRALPCIRVWPTWETLPAFRDGLGAMPCRDGQTPRACFEVVDRCRFPRHVPETEASCRRCAKAALRVSVEVSMNECWKCSQPQRILDIYAWAGGKIVLLAAGCRDLVGVAEVAAARAVSMKLAYSKRAECTYLMHVCTQCRATSGDNFLYGCMGKETPMPMLTEPVWQMVVCPEGHWERVSERMWPAGTIVERPRPAIGLVGASAGLFEAEGPGGPFPECPSEPGVTITPITERNVRAFIRQMTGLDLWP